jgi:hypothetical protein
MNKLTCTAAPFDPIRDCTVIDGVTVCLAPPIACTAAPQPVPLADPLALTALAFAIALIGLALIYRKPKP